MAVAAGGNPPPPPIVAVPVAWQVRSVSCCGANFFRYFPRSIETKPPLTGSMSPLPKRMYTEKKPPSR